MFYIAKITKEGKQTLAEFRDCPGCQTFADPGEDIAERAEEALVGWLEAAMKLGRVPPAPRDTAHGAGLAVEVPSRLAVAILLRRARTAMHMTQAQLANIAGLRQSVIARLETSQSNPTVDTLVRVTAALGTRLEFTIAATEAKTHRAARTAPKAGSARGAAARRGSQRSA